MSSGAKCYHRLALTYKNIAGGNSFLVPAALEEEQTMIRKLMTGEYRLYSRKVNPKTGKRRNLGTFRTRAQAEQHEREIQFFKTRHG